MWLGYEYKNQREGVIGKDGLSFFLKGVAITADKTTLTAKEIIELKSAFENDFAGKYFYVSDYYN